MIYYPSYAGGGMKALFRKVSSMFHNILKSWSRHRAGVGVGDIFLISLCLLIQGLHDMQLFRLEIGQVNFIQMSELCDAKVLISTRSSCLQEEQM